MLFCSHKVLPVIWFAVPKLIFFLDPFSVVLITWTTCLLIIYNPILTFPVPIRESFFPVLFPLLGKKKFKVICLGKLPLEFP